MVHGVISLQPVSKWVPAGKWATHGSVAAPVGAWLTWMPALAALPLALFTTRPPPAAVDSPSTRPRGLSTSTWCAQGRDGGGRDGVG